MATAGGGGRTRRHPTPIVLAVAALVLVAACVPQPRVLDDGQLRPIDPELVGSSAPTARTAGARCSMEGIDAAALALAIRQANETLSESFRVYRHDCLIATGAFEDTWAGTPINLWSATKGMTALVVGRAITVGAIGLDDPISRWFPEADAAHGAITVRELLTQTSGLRFSWGNEVNPGLYDSVDYVLSLPFAHEPGTYFEYAQAPLTLLLELVERATGRDAVEIARTDILGPIGVPDGAWSWQRDRTGHPFGYAYLIIRPLDMGRIGTLLLHEGMWGKDRIIDEEFMRGLSASSPTNPGYGFLTWTNRGEWHYSTTTFTRVRRDRRWIESAPDDAYAFSGMGDQVIWVVPSWDMVITRTGMPTPDAWKYDLFRLLREAVTDVDHGPLPPYVPDGPPRLEDPRVLIDPETWPR